MIDRLFFIVNFGPQSHTNHSIYIEINAFLPDLTTIPEMAVCEEKKCYREYENLTNPYNNKIAIKKIYIYKQVSVHNCLYD